MLCSWLLRAWLLCSWLLCFLQLTCPRARPRSLSLALSLLLSLSLSLSLARSFALSRSLARSLALSLSLSLSQDSHAACRSGTWVSHYTCVSIVQGSVWGLGMGRPFPHVQAWGRHCADNNAGAQRYPFFGSFSDIWPSRHSASPGIRSREDHSDEKITHHEVGWSPVSETTQ